MKTSFRKYIEKKSNETITGNITNQIFSNIVFEDLVIRDAKFENVSFENVDFKNCYLGFASQFLNSNFINCKFFGKYSCLGGVDGVPTLYQSCSFINCKIQGQELLSGTVFKDCEFSGVFKNLLIRETKVNQAGWGTSFVGCNLLDVVFDNLSIYGNIFFENTQLPKSGIILLNNANDILITRAKEIYSNQPAEIADTLSILFRDSIHSGQQILIFDNYFLDDFLKSDEIKRVFNIIIQDHIV
jgi:uncharacterized protein YjbI with pentapeptide repeats